MRYFLQMVFVSFAFFSPVASFSWAAPVAPDLPKKAFHLDKKGELEIGYSQAVRIGDTLYISGAVGEGEMPMAIAQAYDEIKKTLAAHGLDFRHVVKENIYASDIDALIKHKDVRRIYYGDDFPAATWVQAQRLYSPAHVVEVEVIAVFPKGR